MPGWYRCYKNSLVRNDCDISIRMTFADSPDFHTPSAPIRYKGHNPKSPEDDVAGGYIRLSDQHKLRKVRNTVYEDPGNPFHSDAFGLPFIPSLVDDDTNSRDVWERWGSNSIEDPPSPNRTTKDMFSMLSDPFDLATAADGSPALWIRKALRECLRMRTLPRPRTERPFSLLPHPIGGPCRLT